MAAALHRLAVEQVKAEDHPVAADRLDDGLEVPESLERLEPHHDGGRPRLEQRLRAPGRRHPAVHQQPLAEPVLRVGQGADHLHLGGPPLDGVEVGDITPPGPQHGVVRACQRHGVARAPREERGLDRPVGLALARAGVDGLASQEVEDGDQLHRGKKLPREGERGEQAALSRPAGRARYPGMRSDAAGSGC